MAAYQGSLQAAGGIPGSVANTLENVNGEAVAVPCQLCYFLRGRMAPNHEPR